MSMNAVAEVKDLGKRYDQKRVVDGISFEVKRGECFGLLGPNGAGKTTTMKMMYGSAVVEEGHLYVLGMNARDHMREIKSRIGVVPQEDGLDPDFTVSENLLVYSRYHEIPSDIAQQKVFDLLKWLRLEEYAHRGIETLSGGMKRRLVIARSLLNDPELLFLDEPTTGLDPQARLWIWDFFRDLRKQNKSIILTTHYMEEAEQMCDRLAIMDQGKILTVGAPATLIHDEIGRDVVEFECAAHDLNYYLGRLREKGFEAREVGRMGAVSVRENQNAKDVLQIVEGHRVTIRRAGLNDVFLKLSGHHLRDEA